MMETEIDTRWIWETFRPWQEAVAMMTALKRDPFDLMPLEEFWSQKTLPALMYNTLNNWLPAIRKELERRIAFAEKRKTELYDQYDDMSVPFLRRRELMEIKLPVVDEALKQLIACRGKPPFLFWEPIDVIDLKRKGVEEFIRFNFHRFYGDKRKG